MASVLAVAAFAPAALAAGSAPLTELGACSSASDCFLNGDCENGLCVCDPAWNGSAVCNVMSFEELDKDNMPGYVRMFFVNLLLAKKVQEDFCSHACLTLEFGCRYYNQSQASWGGFPIENDHGGFDLVHAQMANSCPLGSWKTNSIVGLSHSTTGNVEGPYEFAETILPHFAHNPTIRRAPNGTYVVFFIGSWQTEAKECALPTNNDVAVHVGFEGSDDACVANTTFDDPSQVREGQDYATFTLPMNATTKDCAASCCSDAKCVGQYYVVELKTIILLSRMSY